MVNGNVLASTNLKKKLFHLWTTPHPAPKAMIYVALNGYRTNLSMTTFHILWQAKT